MKNYICLNPIFINTHSLWISTSSQHFPFCSTRGFCPCRAGLGTLVARDHNCVSHFDEAWSLSFVMQQATYTLYNILLKGSPVIIFPYIATCHPSRSVFSHISQHDILFLKTHLTLMVHFPAESWHASQT